MCVCVCVCVCVYVRACVCNCVHTSVHAHTCAHARTHARTHARACAHTHTHTLTHTHTQVWTQAHHLGRVLSLGGDEALFWVAFQGFLVVASIHDPALILLNSLRCHSPPASFDFSNLDVFPPQEPGQWCCGEVWRGTGRLGSVHAMDDPHIFNLMHGVDGGHGMWGMPPEPPRVAVFQTHHHAAASVCVRV